MVLVCTVMNLIVAEHGDSYDYLLIRGGEFTAITCVVTILLCLIYMTIRAFELDRSFCYDCACPYQMINVFCLQNNFAPLRENVSFHQIFTIIVYCLILSPHNDNAPLLLKGEEFTIITCTISLFFALLFLISIGFGCNRGKLCWDCPCGKLAYVIYFLLMVMWFVAGGVETYATVHYGDWSNNERFNRRAAAAAFCFANGIIYAVLLALTKVFGP